jgi:hypothetical protein
VWGTVQQRAFDNLKQKIQEEPVLAIFNPEPEIIVETDASNFAIGAILGQKGRDGKIRPVMYHSRKMQ